MKQDMHDIKQMIPEKLSEVLAEVCSNPLVFVNEQDIHALTVRRLMEIESVEDLRPTGVTIGRNNKGKASEESYATRLIHKEYGNNVKSARRRPGIPIEAGHLFRSKAATHSDGRRPLLECRRNPPTGVTGTI